MEFNEDDGLFPVEANSVLLLFRGLVLGDIPKKATINDDTDVILQPVDGVLLVPKNGSIVPLTFSKPADSVKLHETGVETVQPENQPNAIVS